MTPRIKPYLFAFLIAFLFISTADIKTTFAQVPDPGTPGPLTVTREEYNFGDTAFTATDFPGPIELLASIHYPVNLPAGPYPVILFMHGRHATCFVGGSALLQWPCTAQNSQSIPSYRGYDYVADVIASHGYVVVSVSANGVNAVDNSVFDLGALARAEPSIPPAAFLSALNSLANSISRASARWATHAAARAWCGTRS
jgi:hypothetical protein